MIKFIYALITFILLASCSSLLKYKKSDEFKNAEFEKKVVIVEEPLKEEAKDSVSGTGTVSGTTSSSVSGTTDVSGAASVSGTATVSGTTTIGPKPTTPFKAKLSKPKPPAKPKKAAAKTAAAPVSQGRQPDTEDSEGFNNQRRPPVDPFRVGESVTHDVKYLGATAGQMVLKVLPFAVVNGKKSYNFVIELKSTSFFSKVFAVDDKVQTYVDYETLVPHVFKLDIRDSGQVKEAQAYYNAEALTADYWEHRYTEKHGHEEKKLSWSILPYSQNPFSAIFYMRVFKYVVGREYHISVADDEKNVVFKAKALERAKISTDAGTFPAVRLKAEIYSRGNLAKASDFYLWVSDDDRKYILRIEVKLPFGSIVSEATKIVEGKP
jgi:hypothetical protein